MQPAREQIESTSKPDKPARFVALDGLRGLFALAVALHHCPAYWHFYDHPLVRSSYLAVDFFFVLSGFVISHSAAGQLGDGRDVAVFMVRRFGRLWPLHALVLVCFVGLEAAKWLAASGGVQVGTPAFGTPQTALAAIPAHLFLMQSLNLFDINTWNEPSWSISSEFYTYLLFALTVLAVRRFMAQLSLAWIALSALVLITHKSHMDVTFDYALLRCVYGFFVGHLVYRCHQARALPSRSIGALELFMLAAVLAFMMAAQRTQLSLLAPLVFAVPIWVFSYDRGALSRVLARPTLQQLGRWSYGIYMVHELVYVLLMRAARALGGRLGVQLIVPHAAETQLLPKSVLSFGSVWLMDAVALGSLAVIVLLAWAAHRWVERPAQAYFNRAADRAKLYLRGDRPVLVAR